MKSIKEFRIDGACVPLISEHLIIHSSGDVEIIKNANVKLYKISKKTKFFKELDSALTLDFKMMNRYIQTPTYYHISVIYDDDTEESHFYIDNLQANNQLQLRSVLMSYIEPSLLIKAVID